MTLLQELTAGPLAAELDPHIQFGNDGQVLEILNRKDIPAKGPVTTSDIKAFLFAYGFWNTIKHGQSLACEEAIDALTLFQTFELGNPAYLARLTQVLDALAAEPLVPDFTETHKNIILSMGDVLISRAEQLGINPTVQDIAQALRG